MKTKKSELADITNLLIEHLEITDNLKEISDVAQAIRNNCSNPTCSFCKDLEAFIKLPDCE